MRRRRGVGAGRIVWAAIAVVVGIWLTIALDVNPAVSLLIAAGAIVFVSRLR